MSNRFRFLWNSLPRYASTLRARTMIAVKNIPSSKLTAPCILSFSLFTWLGFKEKPNAEDEIITSIKHCILFIQKTEYEKAEQLLHVALRQAQQVQHQQAITYIYDVMANLALQREHLEKARKLFVTVTQRIMADGATEDDLRVIHLSTKLARVCHLNKEYETAQLGYEFCLQKLQKAQELAPSDDSKKLLALTEDWYGRLNIDCNKVEEGLKLLLNSYEKMIQVPDIEQEHLVIQLNDIGTIYERLGKLDESIEYLHRAIEIGNSLDMDDLGAMYVNIGRVYFKKQMADTARKYCGQAWKLGVLKKNKEIKDEAELCLREINKQ